MKKEKVVLDYLICRNPKCKLPDRKFPIYMESERKRRYCGTPCYQVCKEKLTNYIGPRIINEKKKLDNYHLDFLTYSHD